AKRPGARRLPGLQKQNPGNLKNNNGDFFSGVWATNPENYTCGRTPVSVWVIISAFFGFLHHASHCLFKKKYPADHLKNVYK
ncbi:hypothetical protein, partial [Enterobacter asburiae]